ncbi:ATP-binding protein [Brevundimonas phoenicis]|uniref:ATP-binding protein n=1 Tax=Brevundimonas sp. 2P05AE TaxID=3132272 RepID=UPI0039A3A59D
MRFSSLNLERYGRFEGCELRFRAGSPDFHIIYGPNEAGKSTSLSAVSDLLFGFPARSAYNFLHSYPLLRVGAVLEDEVASLAVRRKKGTSGTLLDADDRVIDEGPLLAMLRGQTRETFALGFSLDQDGLREGGRAMIAARDDVGRALFAAGAGLTGVTEELARLESEADAIWGPRAAARRTFTQAQRELDDAMRAVRDEALKPKAWLDARTALAQSQARLDDAQRRRDTLLSSASRLERIRQIAPHVRVRADQLAALAALAGVVDMGEAREAAAEAAMVEADTASRDKSVAERLLAEAKERATRYAPDRTVLNAAAEIDALVVASGAIHKAHQDLGRIEAEYAAGATRVSRLREEAGALGAAPPTRIVSGGLRELAADQTRDKAILREIEEAERQLAVRHLEAAPDAASPVPEAEMAALKAAVAAARGLGLDIDERCLTLQRRAEAAAGALDAAITRLAPWKGEIGTLRRLPKPAVREIDEVGQGLAANAAEVARETANARRAREEAEELALQVEQLVAGAGVSEADISEARATRQDRWTPIRDHVVAAAPLEAAREAVLAFESALERADERSDRRFAAADASSRLMDLGQRRARLTLEAAQADARAMKAAEERAAVLQAWSLRLTADGLPDLEPSWFQDWSGERDAALVAAAAADLAEAETRSAREARDRARETLQGLLAPSFEATGDEALHPLLREAEERVDAAERLAQKAQVDQAARLQVDREAAALEARRATLVQAMSIREANWCDRTAAAGLGLEMQDAATALVVVEELRAALSAQADLQARIDGIDRDSRIHAAQVAALLGPEITPSQDANQDLNRLRERLAEARAAAAGLATLEETIEGREAEVRMARARADAASETLSSLATDIGLADREALSAAISGSRTLRRLRAGLADSERAILAAGDGKTVEALVAEAQDADMDALSGRTETLAAEIDVLNAEVAECAAANGDARRAFANLETDGLSASAAAGAAEEARAELGELAEHYILKRAQVVMLRWTIETYRARHQDPLLQRASTLFSRLTSGRYAALRVEADGASPQLLGVRDDGRTAVEIDGMSEGTTDQLFLALRLAAVEQSVAKGVRLPFIADDLFVNFDDERAEAGIRVLAELARSTQVLFFTHHPHLVAIAREVVGSDLHSECRLA